MGCGWQRWQPLAKKTTEGAAVKFSPALIEADSVLCENCGARFQVSPKPHPLTLYNVSSPSLRGG